MRCRSFFLSLFSREIIILIILIVLIIVALLLAPKLINVEKYRGKIQTELQQRLNRPVSFGAMGLSLLPIKIEVNNAAIGEDPHFGSGQFAAVQYTSQARDQALVFFFQRDQVFGGSHPPLRLCHLKPNALYRIEPLRALPTASPLQEYPAVLSGAALMATGLPPLLDNWQTHASYLVKLTKTVPGCPVHL